MTNRERYIFAGLIGVGALVLLAYLLRNSSGQAAATGSDNAGAASGDYPNGQPIPASTFVVGGSPSNITYNQGPPIPDVALRVPDVGGCDCDPCGAALSLQTVQSVAPDVYKSSVANLQSYKAKVVSKVVSIRPTDAEIIAADFGTQGA